MTQGVDEEDVAAIDGKNSRNFSQVSQNGLMVSGESPVRRPKAGIAPILEQWPDGTFFPQGGVNGPIAQKDRLVAKFLYRLRK
jgi:hypothetical protein